MIVLFDYPCCGKQSGYGAASSLQSLLFDSGLTLFSRSGTPDSGFGFWNYDMPTKNIHTGRYIYIYIEFRFNSMQLDPDSALFHFFATPHVSQDVRLTDLGNEGCLQVAEGLKCSQAPCWAPNVWQVEEGLVNVPIFGDYEHHQNKYLLEMKYPQQLGDVQLGHLLTPLEWNKLGGSPQNGWFISENHGKNS